MGVHIRLNNQTPSRSHSSPLSGIAGGHLNATGSHSLWATCRPIIVPIVVAFCATSAHHAVVAPTSVILVRALDDNLIPITFECSVAMHSAVLDGVLIRDAVSHIHTQSLHVH